VIALTRRGRAAFAPLEARSHQDVGALLKRLSAADQTRLTEAMATIESLLGDEARTPPAAYVLRPPRPGDMGWVVQSHGALYAQEYGFDERFEGLVAEIVARFVRTSDRKTDRCWIAEKDGRVVGSVFLVRKTRTVAKLRLLIVDPKARGLGIGVRLVDECVRFARQVGYRKITLWTQSILVAARRIYKAAGFRLIRSGRHHAFGRKLTEETWELAL